MMKSLIFLQLLIAISNCSFYAGWVNYDDNNIPRDFFDAADWAINQMNNILNGGKHNIERVLNAKSQMANGLTLDFTVITTYQSNKNNNIIESRNCDFSVISQPQGTIGTPFEFSDIPNCT